MTQILEYSNVFFSGLFAVEMLLKVIADGLCGYLRVGFNVFDGFIVILRYVSFDAGSTSRAYSNIGMHFDFSSCMTTCSEAIRPIFPKIPLAARVTARTDLMVKGQMSRSYRCILRR